MRIQALGPEPAVEGFNVGIIRHDADGASFPASSQVANLC